MSIILYLRVLKDVKAMISNAPSSRELNRWTIFHTYAVVSYVVSLRGKEGLLLDLEGLIRHSSSGNGSYVVITLQGRVKGETNDRDHLLPCVPITSSGVDVKASLVRLIALKAKHGFVDSPAISDMDGRAFSTRDMSDLLVEILEDVFDSDRALFPLDIVSKEILRERY